MKRSQDGKVKKTPKSTKKPILIEWTVEEDLQLKELICKDKIVNWTTICRRLNKKFPNNRKTAKACENRWQTLNSAPNLNEELMILLTFYRDNLEVAVTALKDKLDVHEYILNLIEKVDDIIKDIRDSVPIPLLSKLQLFVIVDLILNYSIYNAQLHKLRSSPIDWLELAQCLTKEKMTKETLHEMVDRLVENMEDKINLQIEQKLDTVKETMHERKEPSSQPASRQAFLAQTAMRTGMQMFQVNFANLQRTMPPFAFPHYQQ